ncbi:hypothetical protein [Marinomonas fungiae]|uniref:hypothetical protein n=1 Tax=Marinomonas fungiae TaxID=1137284 RepID=UPI003A95CFC7
MFSEQIKLTQRRLAQLMDDTLYPQGSFCAEIASLVKSRPDISDYTLSEIEELTGKQGYPTLVAILRLSMPPYRLFETTFELPSKEGTPLTFSLSQYQTCVLCGGLKTTEGEYIDVETINREASVHIHVNRR